MQFLPDDLLEKEQKVSFSKLIFPWDTIKHGLNFVKINHFYPLLALGSSVFE